MIKGLFIYIQFWCEPCCGLSEGCADGVQPAEPGPLHPAPKRDAAGQGAILPVDPADHRIQHEDTDSTFSGMGRICE